MRAVPLAIAVLATLAVIVQNSGLAAGFVWAAIHGAGPAAAIVFLPAAVAIGLVWTVYVVITRRRPSHGTLSFAAFVVLLLGANELLLPGTPLRTSVQQRALEAVQARNVRDELLLSPRGNPMGIRITFEAVVSRPGGYLISASTLAPVDQQMPWPLSFGSMIEHSMSPEADGRLDIFPALRPGVVYTFTQRMLPNFLSYDVRTEALCLVTVTTKFVSEADFLAALAKSTDMKYMTSVHVDGPGGTSRAQLADYVTSRGYDVQAMYRTAQLEGNRGGGP